MFIILFYFKIITNLQNRWGYSTKRFDYFVNCVRLNYHFDPSSYPNTLGCINFKQENCLNIIFKIRKLIWYFIIIWSSGTIQVMHYPNNVFYSKDSPTESYIAWFVLVPHSHVLSWKCSLSVTFIIVTFLKTHPSLHECLMFLWDMFL